MNEINARAQHWKWVNESLICPIIVTITVQESENKVSQNFSKILSFDHLKYNTNSLIKTYPSKQIHVQSQKNNNIYTFF